MALVGGSPDGVGGRGGVRLIFSGLLQRLLGLRSRRLRTGTPSVPHAGDEDDDTWPLIDGIPRGITRSLYRRDSASGRMLEASPLPFSHPDWPAHQLFDVETAWPESAKVGLEMTAGTRHVTRLPREPVMPPVVVVETTPGQPPMLHIPLTDGLVASVLAQGGPTQWMKVFRALLLAHVFFALPLIVIFFPRYEKGPKKDLLLSLFDSKEKDHWKLFVLGLFVLHASLGSLGVLLAHIADGPDCTGIVGSLTLYINISVVGFIDYIFRKTLPPDTTYDVAFGVHFFVMLLLFFGLWAKFVGFSPCCCSKLDSRPRPPV